MASRTHEDFVEHKQIKTASDRSFGLTVGGIVALIGAVRWLTSSPSIESTAILVGGGLILVVLGLVAHRSLAPLNRLWTGFGLLLAAIVNPLVMLLIYALVFVPFGLVMRMAGRDPLRIKRTTQASSYWIERNPPGPVPGSMSNQF